MSTKNEVLDSGTEIRTDAKEKSNITVGVTEQVQAQPQCGIYR